MNAAPNMKLEPPGWSCHGQCYRMARAKPTRGSTPRYATKHAESSCIAKRWTIGEG